MVEGRNQTTLTAEEDDHRVVVISAPLSTKLRSFEYELVQSPWIGAAFFAGFLFIFCGTFIIDNEVSWRTQKYIFHCRLQVEIGEGSQLNLFLLCIIGAMAAVVFCALAGYVWGGVTTLMFTFEVSHHPSHQAWVLSPKSPQDMHLLHRALHAELRRGHPEQAWKVPAVPISSWPPREALWAQLGIDPPGTMEAWVQGLLQVPEVTGSVAMREFLEIGPTWHGSGARVQSEPLQGETRGDEGNPLERSVSFVQQLGPKLKEGYMNKKLSGIERCCYATMQRGLWLGVAAGVTYAVNECYSIFMHRSDRCRMDLDCVFRVKLVAGVLSALAGGLVCAVLVCPCSERCQGCFEDRKRWVVLKPHAVLYYAAYSDLHPAGVFVFEHGTRVAWGRARWWCLHSRHVIELSSPSRIAPRAHTCALS